MKAVLFQGFGGPDILRCEEVDKPVPSDDEVLVRVRAASINPLDWKTMKGGPWLARVLLGWGKPKLKIPGVDLAGDVEAAGSNVTGFRPGDAVFGACRGAFAEYAVAKAAGEKVVLVRKPENVSFEQAASVPVAGLTALQGLRDHGRLQPGQKALVNGAAGGVGTFAVQIAKASGAQVTAVCSTRNVSMVRSLGADRVVDYTREDFTQSGERYDLILDCVGNRSLSACRHVLRPGGVLVMVGMPGDAPISGILARLTGAIVSSWFVSKKAVFFIAKVNQKDLTILGELLASGSITPVVDRSYKLEEAAEAFRYMEKGHARGKVMVSVG